MDVAKNRVWNPYIKNCDNAPINFYARLGLLLILNISLLFGYSSASNEAKVQILIKYDNRLFKIIIDSRNSDSQIVFYFQNTS